MALTQVQPGMLASDSQYTSMKNRIINGAMVINQRNTAVSTSDTYTVDRWQLVRSSDATESVAQNTDAPAGFTYSLRDTISVGDASIAATQFSGFKQPIEGYNIADFGFGTANAQSITVSFWVRSSVTGQYTGNIANNGYTRMCPFNFTINTANTWEQKTNTFPGDTSGTWLTTNGIGMNLQIYSALGSTYASGTANTWGSSGLNFGCGSPVNGIASNGNIFAISGVQLEKGSTATSFDYRPYSAELAMCQRYYFRAVNGDQQVITNGFYFTSTDVRGVINFPCTMRTSPSLVSSSGTNYFRLQTVGGDDTFNTLLDAGPNTTTAMYLYINANISGTAGNAGAIISNNASASLAFSSEL